MFYFDNAASTKPFSEVVEIMSKLSIEHYANSHSSHHGAYLVEKQIKEASKDLAQDLNCQPEELIFNSGATEGINQAIKGVFFINSSKNS